MFSNRTNWNLESNDISLKINDLKKRGKIFFDLTVSNPTQCHFDFPSEEIIRALTSQRNLIYEPASQGLIDARKVVQQYYASRGFDIPLNRIFLTASTSEGYSFLFRLLGNPNEVVLFPEPSYPLFQFLVDINDLKMQTYKLNYNGQRWSVSASNMFTVEAEKISAIVLVNPNNPTGSLINEDDLEVVNRMASQKQAAIISDEVFLDYLFDGRMDYPSLAGNKTNLTFVLGGVSKALAMPQMKLSWIIINGPDALVNEAIARLDVIADTYLSVNAPAQNALAMWMGFQKNIRDEVMKRLESNRKYLQEKAVNGSGLTLLNSDGGWYAVCKVTSAEGASDIEETDLVLQLLENKGVFVHPGFFFDFQDSPYIVVSLLTPQTIFMQGIDRIIDYLRNL
ncbi:MAG: pyridoxal phosphate-dependent aminotransferase [Candidatus Omnitrophica bacterium]|nr:pyridoxal phosphate-dependent aminotransferase [Candidatus Omnitrophota bacterium]